MLMLGEQLSNASESIEYRFVAVYQLLVLEFIFDESTLERSSVIVLKLQLGPDTVPLHPVKKSP